MNEKKRKQNEKVFSNFDELENGNRKYWFEIIVKFGWKAKYVKIVDKEEITISFIQEIYNDKGELEEIHEKYPVDKGHVKIIKDYK